MAKKNKEKTFKCLNCNKTYKWKLGDPERCPVCGKMDHYQTELKGKKCQKRKK